MLKVLLHLYDTENYVVDIFTIILSLHLILFILEEWFYVYFEVS